MGSFCVDRLKDSGVTIMVHNSGPKRYQILLDLTTVGYFDSCFLGPSRYIGYTENLRGESILSHTWEVFRHKILDLQPEEQQAIEPGR